jgi:AhpD family alkylhydroperoxidase
MDGQDGQDEIGKVSAVAYAANRVILTVMNNQFQRRYYASWREMGRDLLWALRGRRQLRTVMGGGLVSFAFRERLMLAVTAVNACRYCAHYHHKEALRAELPEAEIRQMLTGDLGRAPADELPALLYAQQWAQRDGRADPADQEALQATYGLDKAAAIETVLRLIRMGNLGGNSLDYWLFRLSFGRWGGA